MKLVNYGRAHPKKNKKILVRVASVESGIDTTDYYTYRYPSVSLLI